MIKDLVLANRSYRRFHQDHMIDMNTLRELVDLARCSPSAANMQPLRYVLSCERDKNEKIFSTLAWAAYLKDWPGPHKGERPSAYIVILEDENVRHPIGIDHGIAATSILLGAVEKGLGGCILGAIKKEQLKEALDIPSGYKILIVVALGKPREECILEPLGPDGDIKYWRDERDVHHVPKRALEDIIIG